MSIELNDDMKNISDELEEIRKFEHSTEVDGFVSISALCGPYLTLICC